VRRALLASPLAFIVSAAPACALPSSLSPPSATAADWSEPPTRQGAVLPARMDALDQWMLPAGSPWAGYAKYTLLTALSEAGRRADLPDVASLDDVRSARAAGECVAAGDLPADTLWVVDMRGAASVAFGEAIARGYKGGSVSLVPTFNNWPGPNEVVPAEETLAAMVAMPPQWQVVGGPGAQPVFLLDAWRMAYRSEEPDDDAYDNRYLLSPGDLPDAATLRARGIRRVIYLVESLGDTSVEEDDLNPVFLAWQAAGLAIAMLDLAILAHPVEASLWDDLIAARSIVVEPRATIVDEPSFYARARGGFGGIHARPFRMAGALGGWHGAHGAGG
jgi:hypothetical protein